MTGLHGPICKPRRDCTSQRLGLIDPLGFDDILIGRGRDYLDVPPVKGVYAGPDATGNEVTVRVTRLR